MQESAAFTSTSDRRTLLRNVATSIVGIGATGFAGCVGSSDTSNVTPVSRHIDPDSTPLSKAEFDEYVGEMHDRYGDSGPWGKRGTEPDHELSYVGAWTGDWGTSTTAAGLSSDHLVALYRIPPEKSRGTLDYFQFWLWSGVEPASGETVERLRPRVELSGEEYRMRMYAPASEFTSGPVSVELGQPTAEGLRARIPLSSGTIRVDPEATRVGGAGGYAPIWSGTTESVQSVAATFESSWPASKQREFDWTVRVRGVTDRS